MTLIIGDRLEIIAITIDTGSTQSEIYPGSQTTTDFIQLSSGDQNLVFCEIEVYVDATIDTTPGLSHFSYKIHCILSILTGFLCVLIPDELITDLNVEYTCNSSYWFDPWNTVTNLNCVNGEWLLPQFPNGCVDGTCSNYFLHETPDCLFSLTYPVVFFFI